MLHGVGADLESEENTDLFIGVLREEEGRKANYRLVAAAAVGLSPQGMIILAAGSTAITRLVADLESQSVLRIITREKRKGKGRLVLQRISI